MNDHAKRLVLLKIDISGIIIATKGVGANAGYKTSY